MSELMIGKTSDGLKRPVLVDSTGKIQVGGVQLGNLNVNTDQLEAKQGTTNALLTTIQSDLVAPLPLPTGAATSANQTTANSSLSTIATNTNNLDVALSTRLKPADTLAGVTAVGSITNALPAGTNSIGQVTANAGSNLSTSNLDVALSTRLKPADTLAGVTAVGSITNALPAGTNSIGQVTANAGTNLNTSSLALESGGNLATIATNTGKIPSKGTATIANSTPVNIASDQTVPVSLASVPSHAVTNAGTFAVQNTAATPAGTNSIGTVGLNAGSNTIGAISNTAFTANAGTNLNTSALALESGGNLATIATNTGKIPSLVSGRVPIDGSGVTQPVSGTVGISGTVPVSGTFWQTTQPVSLASLPALASGSNTIGAVTQGSSGTPFTVKDHNAAASGSTFFNDTTSRTGTWYCIQTLAATVFTTLTDSTRGGTSVGSFSFPAGTTFFGNFTTIQLASGTCIAYTA